MTTTHMSAPTVDRPGAGAAVVAATRGIDEPFTPVSWASTIAESLGSPLVVVDACPSTHDAATSVDDVAHLADEAAQLRRRLEAVGLRPDDVRCELGSASSVLVDASSAASVVVIGSHLAKEGHRLGHGRLAHELARRVGCPLAVVPRGHMDRPARIVVGLDGRRGDGAALAWARRMAAAFECPITAVHVVDPLSRMFGTEQDDPAELEARRLADANEVELVVRVGEPVAAEIVDVAATRSAGMVVVGTRQAHGVFGPILGEVTAHLLDQDDVVVVVVPRGRSHEP